MILNPLLFCQLLCPLLQRVALMACKTERIGVSVGYISAKPLHKERLPGKGDESKTLLWLHPESL